MNIWCKLQRGEEVFEVGLLSWSQYLSNKCYIRGRFQSVRFLTPTELSNFPSDTKITKKQTHMRIASCNWLHELSYFLTTSYELLLMGRVSTFAKHKNYTLKIFCKGIPIWNHFLIKNLEFAQPCFLVITT